MYKKGVNLILGIMVGAKPADGETAAVDGTFTPLGHSTGCDIEDSSETGERVTKESENGLFKETYVKSLAEKITADGFVYDGDKMGLPELKDLWLAAQPLTARYQERGDTTKYYQGSFIITSLKDSGPANDDRKWSLSLANSGAISKSA
jgi:hypothetical protein